MAPVNDAPSPSPSTMPPPGNLKRPRASGAAAAAGSASSTATAPRPKRRKPEGSVDTEEGGPRGRAGAGASANQAAKAAEEEEDGEVVTKIDFRDLPAETLYKYLETHDLLPVWQPSPWSERPCIPPHLLYSGLPLSANIASASTPKVASPSAIPDQTDDPTSTEPITSTSAVPLASSVASDAAAANDSQIVTEEADAQGAELETSAAPTTRSKTLPQRRPPTPSPPPIEVNRGVMTLSDILSARDVLAEKANAHWIKGLGGGQNKESETIVNFLYKMKVGPGKLLRVLKAQANAGVVLY